MAACACSMHALPVCAGVRARVLAVDADAQRISLGLKPSYFDDEDEHDEDAKDGAGQPGVDEEDEAGVDEDLDALAAAGQLSDDDDEEDEGDAAEGMEHDAREGEEEGEEEEEEEEDAAGSSGSGSEKEEQPAAGGSGAAHAGRKRTAAQAGISGRPAGVRRAKLSYGCRQGLICMACCTCSAAALGALPAGVDPPQLLFVPCNSFPHVLHVASRGRELCALQQARSRAWWKAWAGVTRSLHQHPSPWKVRAAHPCAVLLKPPFACPFISLALYAGTICTSLAGTLLLQVPALLGSMAQCSACACAAGERQEPAAAAAAAAAPSKRQRRAQKRDEEERVRTAELRQLQDPTPQSKLDFERLVSRKKYMTKLSCHSIDLSKCESAAWKLVLEPLAAQSALSGVAGYCMRLSL